MAINATAFTHTPQAKDDAYAWTEDALLGSGLLSGNVVTLAVMVNDLGGNAKTLYSVDDGNGNTLVPDFDLLSADVTNGVSPWEATAAGNQIRINSGRIEFRLAGSLSSLGASDVNGLAAGDQVSDEFVYAIRMANGTLSQARVTFGITGTNDAPVIAQGPQSGAVKEDETLKSSGQFTATDADHNATQTWSVQGSAAGAYGAIAVDATGTWTYTLANGSGAVQALADGESHTETYTIRVTDDQGAYADRLVTVVVSGTNDAPVVVNAPADAAGAVKEDTTLAAAGQLAASDVDHGATQTWSVEGSATGAYGAIAVDASTGKWTYALANATGAVQALAVGESHADAFAIRVTDDHGAYAEQAVTVIVSGTNDAPVLAAADVTGAVTEPVAPVGILSDSGTISFSDVDITDAHTVSVGAIGTPYGSLTATIAADTTGSGTGGQLAWTYSIPASVVNILAQGEIKTESFNVTVDDGNGGVATRKVDVTITGTNDTPVVNAALNLSGNEGSGVMPLYLLAGASDPDQGSVLHATNLVWTEAGSGLPDGFSRDADSLYIDTSDPAYDSLAQGASFVAHFGYDVTDQFGASVHQTAAVTINGTNDAPVANNDTAALTVTSLASQVKTNVVNWVDWTNSAPGTVTGTINLGNSQSIGVTYTGEYAFAQTNGGTGYYTTPATQPGDFTLGTGTYTSLGVANGPTGSDIIALSQATQKTLTFSQPVENLFFAVVSLNGNGYLFDQDFQILSYGRGYWGDGSASKTVLPDGRFELVSNNNPGGRNELHGVLGIDGTVQSLTWTSQTAEYWNGFTVGTYGKAQTATVAGNLLANDSDVDRDPISVTAVNGQQIVGNSLTLTLASGARVQVNRDGSYLYDENAAFASLGQGQTKPDSFQYTVSDSHAASSTANVTINVTGINDAPVITSPAAAAQGVVQEDKILTATGQLTASDPDQGAAQSWSIVGNATGAYGSLGINGSTGLWTYSLNNNTNAVQALGAGETRNDAFTVQVSDGNGGVASQVVTVAINGTNPTPISRWTANGNANDSAGPNFNNGAMVNGAGFAPGQSGGQAFSFDGVNDYISVADELRNDFTITGWLNTSHASRTGSQFFQGDGLVYADVGGVNNDFGVSVLNNKLAFGTGNPDLTIQSNTNVVTGNWVEFAAVRSGDLISIYINGTLESSLHTGNGGTLNAPSAITFGGNTVDSRYYQGLLDDVNFYNFAVSPLDLVGIAHTIPA